MYSTDQAFAARKNDGSVVTWGDPSYGGPDACGALPPAYFCCSPTNGCVVSLLGVSFWLVFEGTEEETKKHVVSPVSRHIFLQPETL